MVLGIVREDEKAGRGIFALAESVDASDEKYSPVRESERLVDAPQSAGSRRHARAPERAGGGTASRRRFGRIGSCWRSYVSCSWLLATNGLGKVTAHYVSFKEYQIAHARGTASASVLPCVRIIVMFPSTPTYSSLCGFD